MAVIASGIGSAAMVGVIDSNSNLSLAGPGIGNFVANQCNPAVAVQAICDDSAANIIVNFFDGAMATFDIAGSIRDDGVNTTQALFRITNLVLANPTANVVTDTFFFISDTFLPSAPGPVGVGIFGNFSQMGGGNVAFASAQGQMNYLTAPLGGGVVPGGFTLTTVDPFVLNFPGPIGFWAMNVQNDPLGGVVQLVGALQFTLGPGSVVNMPGSMLLSYNDTDALLEEAPEPGTMAVTASGLVGVFALCRRRKSS
jgi:hypothetical protein